MKVAIIKYNAGNTGSVTNALERLGYRGMVTDDPDLLIKADKVIFPGVGEAGTTMKYLRDKGLDKLIPELRQPVLGICLGMQLMCARSEEGQTEAMDIFGEEVNLFTQIPKVPHMGWNSIEFKPEGIFNGLNTNLYVYFVHSYYVKLGINTLATCSNGIVFSAALQKDNFYAVQFHPEKSGTAGQVILKNFLEL